MTKLISTISVLVIFLTAISCRQQDEDFPYDAELNSPQNIHLKEKDKHHNDDAFLKRDSIKKIEIIYEGDPPPKNGQHWKIDPTKN